MYPLGKIPTTMAWIGGSNWKSQIIQCMQQTQEEERVRNVFLAWYHQHHHHHHHHHQKTIIHP
jgi:hypothetical protein